MLQAVQIMRAPTENFYNSLSDEQKQRLDAMGASTNANRRQREPEARGSRLDAALQRVGGELHPVAGATH
jgi:LTXXQ motif family protein